MNNVQALDFPEKKTGSKEKPKLKAGIRRAVVIVLALIFLSVAAYAAKTAIQQKYPEAFFALLAKAGQNKFNETFNAKSARKIEEAGKMSQSSSKNWWVNSGGWMEISGGTGKTIQGDLAEGDRWHQEYARTNPKDTDNGLHPQNIFRLVTRKKWQNFRQEAYFKINKINLSSSDNRNESNGILLFNRYQDGNNLYYTGLRVDGYAVIKKKIGGKYYTLDEKKVFEGGDYDRDSNPNLLPLAKWIGLRSVVATNKDGTAEINFFYKMGLHSSKKKWKLAAHYVDKGQNGDVIKQAGYGGIRTDFMDVEFDKYRTKKL